MKIKHLSIIFAFILLLFLIPNQDNNVISYTEINEWTDFSFQEVGEAQIFQTVPVDLNLTYVQTVASELMEIGGTTSESEDLIVLNNGSKIFEMYTACGSIWYADESKLWNISTGADLPELATCISIADAFIAKSSYIKTPQFKYLGSTNATAYHPEGEITQEKILNINVNYRFELNGIKMGGPGGTSSVSIGDGGEIIGLNWVDREIIPLHYEPVISFEDAMDLYGLPWDETIEYELVYYQAEVGELQNYLYPVYECELTQTVGNSAEGYTSQYALPATLFNPTAKIINPVNGKAVQVGDSVEFESNVTGGIGPYTYLWESDIDGIISTAENFTIDSLTVAKKDNVVTGHTIKLTITDANGLISIDIITIEITENTALFGFEPLLIVGMFGIVLSIFITGTKNRKRKSLLIISSISMIFLTSTILRIATVRAQIKPTIYVDTISICADDGDNEIGTEYVSYSGKDRLIYSDDIARRFHNKLGGSSLWDKSFKWGNSNAWEADYKESSYGGWDSIMIDAVDFAYFSGHGNPNEFVFSNNHDDNWLHYTDAEWGDGDLEWINIDACLILKKSHDGKSVFERWSGAMKGLHMILSFHTTSRDSPSRGEKFAKHMRDGHTIKYSWFKAAKQTNSWKKWSAIFYGSLSDDTWNPQQDDCIHDHINGYGYVSSDPINPKWYVWIASQC